ncbi:MAG: FtsX-like permease family protein [Candidatus Moraniibacteriota bacterium]
MTTRDLLKLSTRMFTARRGRTVLTVLGMGIGFGAILFLVSLGYGLQEALLNQITSSNSLLALDVSSGEAEGNLLVPEAVREMEKIDGVEKIEASYNFNARIKFGDTASDAQAVVADPGFIELEGVKIEAGKSFAGENPKEILVSSAFSKIFGKSSEELVGQKVSFSLFIPEAGDKKNETNVDVEDFQIAGVTKNEESVFYAKRGSLAIPAENAYAKLKVKCHSSEAMNSVKDAISQKGFSISSLSETVAEVNKLFRVVNIVLGLFGIVTLVVSSIGMFNTMTVALLERTREIGIMKSIGASRTDIMLMFVIESTLMGFAGGIAGIILGVASGLIMNLSINAIAKYFGGSAINFFVFPLWFLGSILLFSIVIGIATGIGPAKRASSLDPLEALRSR